MEFQNHEWSSVQAARKRVQGVFAVAIGALALIPSHVAAADIDAATHYSNLVRSQGNVGQIDSGLMGESIDYYSGRTDFVATDVILAGNFSLPMAIGRRYHVTNQAGGLLQGAFGEDWRQRGGTWAYSVQNAKRFAQSK